MYIVEAHTHAERVICWTCMDADERDYVMRMLEAAPGVASVDWRWNG